MKSNTRPLLKPACSLQDGFPPKRAYPRTILLGPDGGGKTSLAHYLVHSNYRRPFKATVGVDLLGSKGQYIWDTGNREYFKPLLSSFIAESKLALLVFPASERLTPTDFDAVVADAGDLLKIVVLTKIDLVSRACLKSLTGYIEERGLACFQVSVKSGKGLKQLRDAYATLTDQLLKHDQAALSAFWSKVRSASLHAKGRYGCRFSPPDEKEALVMADLLIKYHHQVSDDSEFTNDVQEFSFFNCLNPLNYL